jgi:hypothetical protein
VGVPSDHASRLLELYSQQRQCALAPDELAGFTTQLGPVAFAAAGVRSLLVVQPAPLYFPESHTLATPQGRRNRWAIAYEYMIPPLRAQRNSRDIFLTPGMLVVEAGTAMVIAYYFKDDGVFSDAAATAASIADSLAVLPQRYRHPAGETESCFYMTRDSVTAHGAVQLPGAYSMYPAAHPCAAATAVCTSADAAGAVHMPAVHYAQRRVARGTFSIPAWMRITPRSPAQHAHAVVSDVLQAAIAKQLARAAQLLLQIAPSVVDAQLTVAAAAGYEPISTKGHNEAFASCDYIAAPHDGMRDNQYGFATTLCAETAPRTGVSDADRRALVILLGDVRLRLPVAHARGYVWRPSMYPHGLMAPAWAEVPVTSCDVVVALQLGRATTDRLLNGTSAAPHMIIAERELRRRRFEAQTEPWPDASADTAAVWAALKGNESERA